MSETTPSYLEVVALRKKCLQDQIYDWLNTVNGAPMVLEFGSGHGHFLTQYARSQKEKKFLGLDLMGGRLARAERKAVSLGLSNIHFLKAEATEFLEFWPKQALLTEVFMLFPDPWPKRKHHKNRMIQKSFLDQLAHCVQENGIFYFRTDDASLAEWTQSHLEDHARWKILPNAPWPFDHPTVFQLKADHHFSIAAQKIG